jgi:hypothetical protein
MDSIQRLNYFTSQFLVEDDFQDEQTYHREMRHRHNRSLHTPGVVEGLIVSKVGDRQIKVSAGMAIDPEGQEMILLAESGAIALSGANTDVFVTIQYGETKEVPDTTSGLVNQFRRIQEEPAIAFSTFRPSAKGSLILLASVKLDANGNIVGEPNNEVKTVAGAAIAPQSVNTDQLIKGAVTKDKMAINSVGSDQLVSGAVTKDKLTISPQDIGALSTSGGTVTGDLTVEGNVVAKSIVAKPNVEIKNTSPGSTFKFTKTGEFEAIPNLAANIVTRGNPVLITANFSYGSGGKAGNTCMFTIQRITDSQLPINLAGSNTCLQLVSMTGEANVPVAIVWIDTPPKGSHRYTIAGRVLSTNQIPIVGPTDAPTTAQISVIELN